MRNKNSLGKIMLLMPIMVLASCAGVGEGDWPSLAADDLWDQMAGEREKPMPTAEKQLGEAESGDSLEALPVATSSAPLSIQESDAHRRTLVEAEQKYQVISKALEAGFQELEGAGVTGADKRALWRTLQLHLSRLANLKKNMDQAIGGIDRGADTTAGDQILLDNSRTLLAIIDQRLVATRSRLRPFSQN